MAAGLAAAVYIDRHWSSTSHLLAPFPALIALLGPGSMAMHATQSSLGGRFDLGSMYLVAGFAAAYGIARIFGRGLGTLATLFVVLVVAAEIFGASDIPAPLVDTAGNLAFAVLLLVAVLVEVVIQRRPEHPQSWRWALVALGAMVVAFVIWSLSHSGGPWCDPNSWLQGHAVWHLLCALAAYALFRFYASERAVVRELHDLES
ncbi:ceramidase [Branchiibius hedensis]|uniref:Ceramidase n=1 Tax=Branchiibius hedensis TaxID=672460 RepID=A0A2Y8ZRQ5_9MICO|nr:ceramidase [Branchiibius hedensis]SSA35051.1 Ceramidase [Branchiibius hedensis]